MMGSLELLHSRPEAMKKVISFLILFLSICANARALDGFEKVQCGSDIPAALVGQRLSDEPTAAVEARHGALGLKDLGGNEISDRLFSASWLICGSEFELILDKRSVIRDALQFPSHSKSSPGFIGSCQVDGKKAPETIVAVLENKDAAEMLAAKAAWKIDEKSAKFVKTPVDGFRCPRDGIFSVDGGQ
jgi:hypothetical protein